MSYNEFKEKIFAERSDAKSRYDKIEISMKIAYQVRTLRKELGLTQKELAQRMGNNQSNISKLESGTYNPSLKFMINLAKSLGKKLKITLE